MSNILKFDFKLTYLNFLNRLDLEKALDLNYRDVQGLKHTYLLILDLWTINLCHQRNNRIGYRPVSQRELAGPRDYGDAAD